MAVTDTYRIEISGLVMAYYKACSDKAEVVWLGVCLFVSPQDL